MARGEMRAPEGAEHGTGAALRRLAGTVQAPPAAERPRVATPVAVRGPIAALEEPEDVSGGYDEELFAPSDRSAEPITQGAPFGPGRSFTILPYEDRRSFFLRVADQLEASDQAGALKGYIDKIRAGG